MTEHYMYGFTIALTVLVLSYVYGKMTRTSIPKAERVRINDANLRAKAGEDMTVE